MYSASRDLYGKINIDQMIKKIELDADLYEGENGLIGTLKGLSQELLMNQFVDQTMNKFSSKVMSEQINLNDLSQDQKLSLEGILNNKDQVMVLDGPAGTGKSFMLQKLVSVLNDNQWKVQAIAPTASATNDLDKELKLNSQTLQKFLIDHAPESGSVLLKEDLNQKNKGLNSELNHGRNFLIVDEAGLMSSQQMSALLNVAKNKNLQVLLVGDTRQHHSVESGDALRSLKKYSNVKVYHLNEVKRQKDVKYKEIVKLLQNQEFDQAWQELDKKGHIIESNLMLLNDLDKVKSSSFIRSYFDKINDIKSVIVITPTRFELDHITGLIRQEKFKDYTGPLVKKEVYHSLRFTEAEKRNVNSYIIDETQPMRIHFQKKYKNFKSNESWQVKEKKDSILTIDNGLRIEKLDLLNMDSKIFDVVQKKELELKIDDQIVIQKNNKSKGIINGEIASIRELNDTQIKLSNGKVLNLEDNFLDYGYVTTSYSSQGKTCDHVLVFMSNNGGKAISSEQFYVSMCRAKQSAEVYVESKEFVEAMISKMSTRKLNQEIIKPQNIETILKHPETQNLDLNEVKLSLQNLVNQNKLKLSELESKNLPQLNKEKINSQQILNIHDQKTLNNSDHFKSSDKSEIPKKNLSRNYEIDI